MGGTVDGKAGGQLGRQREGERLLTVEILQDVIFWLLYGSLYNDADYHVMGPLYNFTACWKQSFSPTSIYYTTIIPGALAHEVMQEFYHQHEVCETQTSTRMLKTGMLRCTVGPFLVDCLYFILRVKGFRIRGPYHGTTVSTLG